MSEGTDYIHALHTASELSEYWWICYCMKRVHGIACVWRTLAVLIAQTIQIKAGPRQIQTQSKSTNSRNGLEKPQNIDLN